MTTAIYLTAVGLGLWLIIRRLIRSSTYDGPANGGRSATGYHRGKDSTVSAYDRRIKEISRERDPA